MGAADRLSNPKGSTAPTIVQKKQVKLRCILRSRLPNENLDTFRASSFFKSEPVSVCLPAGLYETLALSDFFGVSESFDLSPNKFGFLRIALKHFVFNHK